MPTRRVFVSASSNKNLDDRRKTLKAGIVAKVRKAGFEPQEFWQSGMVRNMAWSFDNVNTVMRKCVGAIVIGFPRWPDGYLGEYNHYEGAVALSQQLPTFLLAENGVQNRGIVWT